MQIRSNAPLPTKPRTWDQAAADLSFPWGELPTPSLGGIQYIPALDLMMVLNTVGEIHFFDPVRATIVKRFAIAANVDGIIDAAYVPTCHKLVVPLFNGGSGIQIWIINLTTGATSVIFGLNAGVYSAVYCPVNDKVYVAAQGATPTVYVVDPWTEALHTTSTVSGTFGGVTAGGCFCPLNGKVYFASRTANNVYRIDPATNAIESTFSSGAAYDSMFYADAMRKILLCTSQGLVYKTIDPLNSDAVASLGFGSTCVSGCSSPKTGETMLQNGNTLDLIDASGTQTCHMIEPSLPALYFGWNPVTERFWATDARIQVFSMEPVEHTLSGIKYMTYARPRLL